MGSTGRFCTAVAFAVLGTAALPAVASAEETDCVGAMGPATVDNLRVPDGATCELDGTIVEGTIKVETDATLDARFVRVVGNVQGENAERVRLTSSEVGGQFQVKQGGGAEVTESRITGDVQLDQNDGSLQRVADNDVNGSVQVMENVGGVEISRNIIDGNLQCKENEPPPTGGGNEVQGNAEDQCEALAGGGPGAGPGGDGALVAAAALRVSQRGVVSVPLRCAASSRCTGRVRLLARGGRVAQSAALRGTRFAIAAGGSKAVRVRLNRRGRARLRRADRLRVVVAVAGRGGIARRAVTLTG
jgi:hypothetical protein